MKRYITGVVCAATLLAARQVHAQQPLQLSEVYTLARENNPRLKAAAALVEAKRAQQPGASALPDPQMQLGTMPSIQLMEMLPTFGKLGVNRKIATQSTAIATAEANEAWWEVRAEAGMDFFEIYQAEREIAVMRETLKLLQDFRKVAQAMYSAGEGRQADVLRAGVEIARMQAEITRMQAMRVAAAARLNGVLNRPSKFVFGDAELPQLPAEVPSLDTLRAWAEVARPMLERGRTEVAQAETRSQLARKELWPDLSIGVQYGPQPTQMGVDNMASLMVGFSVPLFAGKRQLKMREEAEAMRLMAQADLQGMRAKVDARIGEIVAHLEHNRTLIKLYNSEVLPQAQANVQSAFSSYRVGQVDFMTLVDAQMSVNKYKQELAALVADYGAGITELEMTIGRELPVAQALRAEAY